MWKTARRQLARRVWTRPVPCGGHHWHVTGRGWACCHCPARASARRAAPEPGPVPGSDRAGAVECTQPAAPTGGLQKWLARIGPPKARQIVVWRRGPATPNPDRELERV